MSYEITREEVWIGAVEDRPGGLADKLEALSDAGEDLGIMLAMRNLDMPGSGVLLCAPLTSEASVQAAEDRGMSKWTTVHALRIEGPDSRGPGASVARAIADARINLRGASAVRHAEFAIFHLAFDSARDANKAHEALYRVLVE